MSFKYWYIQVNILIINLEVVAKWLDVNKNNIKKVLVKHFDKNFDYTIEKKKKRQINSRGATIYEEILITPNCMKELCMVSFRKLCFQV